MDTSKARYYYRCTNPQVLAGLAEFFKRSSDFARRCEEFANRYGGKPYYYSGWEERFAGIGFERGAKPPNEDQWTKPQRGSTIRRPKATSKELLAEYNKDCPKGAVSYDLFKVPMGLPSGGLGGHPGVTMAKDGTYAMIMSSDPITVSGMQELTASEFIKQEKEISHG